MWAAGAKLPHVQALEFKFGRKPPRAIPFPQFLHPRALLSHPTRPLAQPHPSSCPSTAFFRSACGLTLASTVVLF